MGRYTLISQLDHGLKVKHDSYVNPQFTDPSWEQPPMFDYTVRILIADDDADTRSILVDYLTHCGYEAWGASDGEQALAVAQTHVVDVVLLDVVMPGLSGMELIPRLRALLPDVVIILLTAYGTVPQAVEAMREGAFDYLEKPPASLRQPGFCFSLSNNSVKAIFNPWCMLSCPDCRPGHLGGRTATRPSLLKRLTSDKLATLPSPSKNTRGVDDAGGGRSLRWTEPGATGEGPRRVREGPSSEFICFCANAALDQLRGESVST